MTDSEEQLRKIFPRYRLGNHPFGFIKSTLENEKQELCAKSALGRGKTERLHDFPSRPQIALSDVSLGDLGRKLEIVRTNRARAFESCARLFEATEAAESASDVRPNVLV